MAAQDEPLLTAAHGVAKVDVPSTAQGSGRWGTGDGAAGVALATRADGRGVAEGGGWNCSPGLSDGRWGTSRRCAAGGALARGADGRGAAEGRGRSTSR